MFNLCELISGVCLGLSERTTLNCSPAFLKPSHWVKLENSLPTRRKSYTWRIPKSYQKLKSQTKIWCEFKLLKAYLDKNIVCQLSIYPVEMGRNHGQVTRTEFQHTSFSCSLVIKAMCWFKFHLLFLSLSMWLCCVEE